MAERGERHRYHHGDLRNALCRHALLTIETEGIAALSLRESARALGVAPSAVYRHFADKAALVAAVAGDGFARLVRSMESAAASAEERAQPGGAEPAALVAMAMAYVRFAAAHPAHFAVMFQGGAPGAGDPHRLLGRAMDRVLPGTQAANRRAARRAVVAAVHGLALLVASGPPEARAPAACATATREMLEVVLRGAQRN